MKTSSVKGTIKRKIVLIIVASVATVILVAAILTYFFSSTIFMNTLGKEYSQIAYALNAYTIDAIESEIEDAVSYTTRPLWQDVVIESNSRYSGLDAESIRLKLLDMDKRWISAGPQDPMLKEYLESRVSLGAMDTLRARNKIAEIFITDKYGGLVAASGKTSDFYQADEEWWQRAYNGGAGGVYVSGIEFDESSKSWVISIAVPIMDPKSHEIIGICKDSVGIVKLFENLADFKLGRTGHAALIDSNGAVLFHHGLTTMAKGIFPEKILRKMLSMKSSYLVMNSLLSHDRKIFVAFDAKKPPHFLDGDPLWIMLVAQDMSEASGPIRDFVIQISIIAILAMILIIPVGYFFGNLITDPIRRLRLATEKIMAGDWDYKIDVKTGDEIEQFAGTFKDMIADIKSKQEELQSFSNGLEAKVEDRTKELLTAQEATLNMLEDLQQVKEDLEKANKELVKLDQLKSDFISTVSHELRTPLSIIKEGISLVLDNIPGRINEKQEKILNIAKFNIDRLARIIDNLLDISKIEAGKVDLRMGLINISDIVKETAASFEGAIKNKGLELRLDIDKVTESVYADSDRITQVLTNLIGNAVKFTPSGSINISCKDENEMVTCSVADTGPGISKDDLPKVFGKFQQFDRQPGAGDKGTGLGLSIAKGIIDMHNGDIWVESESGKGARFTFKLHKYTSQSLFREYVARAMSAAADKGTGMSIIAMNSDIVDLDGTGALKKKFYDIMQERARLIKRVLNREGDDVVNNGREMIVILADCDKECSAKVQQKIEEAISRNIAEHKMDGITEVKYGRATYPDDGKNPPELIEKARAALAISAKT